MGDWAATLSVCVGENGRLLTPIVLIHGRPSGGPATVRVELVDELERVRRVSRRPLPGRSLGRNLRMPSVSVPDGAVADDVVGWPWQLVIEGDTGELVRWRRYLTGRPSLNAECEIQLPESRDARRAKEEAEGKGPEALWNERDSERLLAVLVDEGELTERERDAILATRAASGKTVERALVDSGWVDEHDLLALYAEVTGTEFVDLTECAIDPDAAALIPEEMALRYGLIAIGFRDNELLTVAMSDPQHPRAALDVEAASWRRAYIVVATRADVFLALETTLLRSLITLDERGATSF